MVTRGLWILCASVSLMATGCLDEVDLNIYNTSGNLDPIEFDGTTAGFLTFSPDTRSTGSCHGDYYVDNPGVLVSTPQGGRAMMIKWGCIAINGHWAYGLQFRLDADNDGPSEESRGGWCRADQITYEHVNSPLGEVIADGCCVRQGSFAGAACEAGSPSEGKAYIRFVNN